MRGYWISENTAKQTRRAGAGEMVVKMPQMFVLHGVSASNHYALEFSMVLF